MLLVQCSSHKLNDFKETIISSVMVSFSRPRHSSDLLCVNKRTISQLCRHMLALLDLPFHKSPNVWAGRAQQPPAASQSGCLTERGCRTACPVPQEVSLDMCRGTRCSTPTEKQGCDCSFSMCLVPAEGKPSKKTPALVLRMPGHGVPPPGSKRELHYRQNEIPILQQEHPR